jgi:hypothetical protein
VFATILYPSYEFFCFFDGAGGRFRGCYLDEKSERPHLDKLLSRLGF